jgi:hypothetical protein
MNRTCRVCAAPDVDLVLDLGRVPLANQYRTTPNESEKTYPLSVSWCRACGIVQLDELVDATTLFGRYLYTPSASSIWLEHCDELAEWLWRRLDRRRDAFVVEPASNDGCLLRSVGRHVSRVLGVEPAANIAEVARSAGVPTETTFFTEASAGRLREMYGPADAIVATNVLAHVPDMIDFLKGARALLARDGFVAIEAPYLGDLIRLNAFDTIYHEHVSYLSVTALRTVFDRAGMTLVAVEPTPVHGGSIRFTGSPNLGMRAQPSVADYLDMERRNGYLDGSVFHGFADRVEDVKREFRRLVRLASAEGLLVGAYGATAKGNTLLCSTGIGVTDIQYIVDRNSLKQGMFAPGSGIPIVSREHFLANPIDILVVLAWNILDEVEAQEREFIARGGRLLVPLPTPHYV